MGCSSPLYARLYGEGLINGNFGCGYEAYPGCAFLCMGGESRDPKAVEQAILDEARRLADEGIDQKLWDRLKKGIYGSKVRGLNSFENICVEQAQSFFAGFDFFRFPEVFASLKKEDAERLIADWVKEEQTCLSVVSPRGEQKA